jgi:group I intron endonuclease
LRCRKINCIYVAFNNVSGRAYIGKTKCTLEVRKAQHEKCAFTKPTAPFHKAIKSYGVEAFSWFELFEEISEEDVNEAERFYIKEFIDDGYNLYNITSGGEGGDTLTNNPDRIKIIENMRRAIIKTYQTTDLAERIKHIAVDRGYGKWMIGKLLTKEHKNNISKSIQNALLDEDKRNRISHKGQQRQNFTKEHRDNLSKAAKKPKTLEHCKSISFASLGKWHVYHDNELHGKLIKPEEFAAYQLQGWRRGRKLK